MVKTAIFPVSVETLPLVRYLRDFSREYIITTLIALPGVGLCGKDIGYADNRNSEGLIVSDSVSVTREKWDVLLVAEYSECTDPFNIHSYIIEAINDALHLRKNVVCAAILTPQELTDIYELAILNNCTFEYLPGKNRMFVKKISGELYTPPIFIIFVGGIISEVNSLEVFLTLVGEMRSRYSLNVLPISSDKNCRLCDVYDLSSFIYTNYYSEVEKVYAINEYLKEQCEMYSPDVIAIHISEPMIEYNGIVTNGFGIIPYIISKAVSPDYFICGIPYQIGHSEYINVISSKISDRLGYGIDCIHMSNLKFDSYAMLNLNNSSVAYTTYDKVEKQIKEYSINSEALVGNYLISTEREKLIATMIACINKNKEITSML